MVEPAWETDDDSIDKFVSRVYSKIGRVLRRALRRK